VTLIWPDRAIAKQWLQVTVKADGVTGLATPDVFYFGNALGDSGNSSTNTFVDGSDFAGSRDNPRNFLNRAPITFAYDYNRDSFVDGTDLALARDNNTNFLTALQLIAVPLTPALSPEYRGEGAERDLTALRLLDLSGLAPVPAPLTPALSPEGRGPMVGSESQPTLAPVLRGEGWGEGRSSPGRSCLSPISPDTGRVQVSGGDVLPLTQEVSLKQEQERTAGITRRNVRPGRSASLAARRERLDLADVGIRDLESVLNDLAFDVGGVWSQRP
jgi:hypothetical protein